MTLPNLIIIGAPRCGTSSLFKYLKDHPEVCTSKIKETFYLMDKEYPILNKKTNFHKQGVKGYERLFDHCKNKNIVLEGTTHYLYSNTAFHFLSNISKKPHIIVILRNPSERIYSSFKYKRDVVNELDKNLDFKTFVDIITKNPQSLEKYGKKEHTDLIKLDLECSNYSKYLTRWSKKFGEKLIIINFEKFVNDPLNTMINISKKIGLDYSFYKNYKFERENPSYEPSNKSLHKLIKSISKIIPKNVLKDKLRRFYLSKQMVTESKTDIPKEDIQTLRKLDKYFNTTPTF